MAKTELAWPAQETKTAARLGVIRLLRLFPQLREGLVCVRPAEFAAAVDDLASLTQLDSSGCIPGALGDLPMVVITHGQPFPGPFALLEKGWAASQQRLAALSSQSTLLTAEQSNHMIHIDQPGIVVHAIQIAHERFVSVDR